MTEIVSSPFLARSSVKRAASATGRISICRSSVSSSASARSTFLRISASCARLSSSQNTAGAPVARARSTASRTQSATAASLVWQPRQMSPGSTSCSSSVSPEPSTTRTLPAASISKVLSWLPYSSAFCAIRPTLGVVPIVAGSNAPCSRQKSIVSA